MDNDLEWRGWQRSASEALMKASCDEDPAQVLGDTENAILAAKSALQSVGNPAQRIITESLLDAAHEVRRRARGTGP